MVFMQQRPHRVLEVLPKRLGRVGLTMHPEKSRLGATRAAGRAFVERYYKQSYSRTAPTPTPPRHTPVPADWAPRLRQLRVHLGLTQTQLAQRIGTLLHKS